MTDNLYSTGYNGTTRYLNKPHNGVAPLVEWSHWKGLDPEMQRRVLAMMDASIRAGRPIGIGEIVRSTATQESLFLSRHVEVTSGGCCMFNGRHYALRPGVAHAAPPGRSYHEPTTPAGKSLALDMTGDLRWMADNCAKYGLMQFSAINGENWHIQGTDYPTGRSRYNPAIHNPLKPFTLPLPPIPAPTKVYAPSPVLKQGGQNPVVQVRALQNLCNFWGWRDAQGRTLLVDGGFGAKTEQAVRSMQKALGRTVDGVYGSATATSLQAFLDHMVSLKG